MGGVGVGMDWDREDFNIGRIGIVILELMMEGWEDYYGLI